jgi:hypothetical protein
LAIVGVACQSAPLRAFAEVMLRSRNLDVQLIEKLLALSTQRMKVIQETGTLCEVYPARRYCGIKRWPVRERIELPHLIHRTGHHVHHTTGFDREEVIDLCIRINSVQPRTGSPNWPPCLGLFKSVVATLTYMRHNRTQAEIGESLGVSQPTISRAISAMTPLVPEQTFSSLTGSPVPLRVSLPAGSACRVAHGGPALM